MTSPKTQQSAASEQQQLIALRRDLLSAMDRMLSQQPLNIEEANILCGLVQAYSMLGGHNK